MGSNLIQPVLYELEAQIHTRGGKVQCCVWTGALLPQSMELLEIRQKMMRKFQHLTF